MANPNQPGPSSSINFRQVYNQLNQQSGVLGSSQPKVNQPFLLDLVTLDRLFFQTIPLNIDITPDSKWVAVESPGRNNPLYQYTGSEDAIEFTITWYSDHASRQDVISKCKWIESLTKNDGYDNKPHAVQLIFGDLFKDSKFIVEKAAYQLARFNREFNMLPTFAEQKITLKRITTKNLSRTEILKYTV